MGTAEAYPADECSAPRQVVAGEVLQRVDDGPSVFARLAGAAGSQPTHEQCCPT